eukprot:CAMPEP_0204180836 /NCGR_PEP_ID=MMETSP0361-20130328/51363_1 /ASSEMBLY_ACC=CAM_ASM_000343 /TAXON_ID=268821 /ORGANISM="Scrippsiella Hangoei, Strain SHTV-5" /LENGTH=130 /DNA_ID=CAMNT_0051140319 /DNA_START=875 /DNA_END=1267 /DNA_ORIENTATION=+
MHPHLGCITGVHCRDLEDVLRHPTLRVRIGQTSKIAVDTEIAVEVDVEGTRQLENKDAELALCLRECASNGRAVHSIVLVSVFSACATAPSDPAARRCFLQDEIPSSCSSMLPVQRLQPGRHINAWTLIS